MAGFGDDLFDFCEDAPAPAAPTKGKSKKQNAEKGDKASNVRWVAIF